MLVLPAVILTFFILRIAAVTLITDSIFYYAYSGSPLLNYTDHEKLIVEEIKHFSKSEWFKSNKGSFGKFSSVPFAETLTKRGFAFSFNILDDEDLINPQA